MIKTAGETLKMINSMGYSVELAEKFAIALAGNPAFVKINNDTLFNEKVIIDAGYELAWAFIEKMQNITVWESFIHDEEEASAQAEEARA